MAFRFGPQPIGPVTTDNLLLHLDAGSRVSYPAFGTIWYDLTNNNYDANLGKSGAATNLPTFEYLNRGYFDFDTRGNFASGSFASQPFTNQVTLEAWVYHNSLGTFSGNSGGVQRYISTTSNGFNEEQCVLRTSNYLGAGAIHFYIVDNLAAPGFGSYHQISQAGELSINQWYHTAGTYDGTYLKIYKNGVLVKSQNEGSYTIKSLSNNAYYIGINSLESMDGRISQARVYNRALSDAEILFNYNQSSNRYI